MAKNWYSISAKSQAADIYVLDEIGAYGVTAKAFIGELGPLAGRPLTLHINSPGGDMFAALAIYNALDTYPGKVTAVVEGVAASAASFIAMAADYVIMPENSLMMIHDAHGAIAGGVEAMNEGATLLKNLNSAMADAYAAKTGLEKHRIVALMAATTWMTALEAESMGFCDEMRAAVRVAAHHDLSTRYPDAPDAHPRTLAALVNTYWSGRGRTPAHLPTDPNDISDLVPTPHRTAAEAIAAFSGRHAGRRR